MIPALLAGASGTTDLISDITVGDPDPGNVDNGFLGFETGGISYGSATRVRIPGQPPATVFTRISVRGRPSSGGGNTVQLLIDGLSTDPGAAFLEEFRVESSTDGNLYTVAGTDNAGYTYLPAEDTASWIWNTGDFGAPGLYLWEKPADLGTVRRVELRVAF